MQYIALFAFVQGKRDRLDRIRDKLIKDSWLELAPRSYLVAIPETAEAEARATFREIAGAEATFAKVPLEALELDKTHEAVKP